MNPKNKQEGCAAIIVVFIMCVFIGNMIFGGNNKDTKKAETVKTEQTSASSSIEDAKTLENYAKNDRFLGEYEYNAEYDIYIVSGDLGTSFGDKTAIKSFNDIIYDAVHQGFKTDKPVVFRGWYNQQDTTLTGALIYFGVDNFNRDWAEINFDSTKTYQFSDGWQMTSKFGQYLSSTSKANDANIEKLLFNLSMLSK
ncbi:TPA: sporulation protein [Streptococcus pyogenes]|nr:sporulation protein [Streptococcus pyogenes]